MAYAFIQDIAASWDQYERFLAGAAESTTPGLIMLLAGPTDEGVRVVAVWDDEETFKRFQTERLQPAIAALGTPPRPEPTFRDLHPAHVVLGTNPTSEPKEEQPCPTAN